MARISFDNVSKHFDGATALHQFSLEIEDGEFVVLVGPSGCGKSTALRLLAGLETVSEGEIWLDGRPVTHTTPQQRNIAMVFQNYALYPHMTVRGNLAFPLKMMHLPARHIADKVTEIAGLLNLTDVLNRKPKQLSGGQRQRVAMGRALVRDPSVFLLDEPLSNLDAGLRARIRADIATLQKRLGKTTLYVTHDQVEAMTLGGRVAVIRNGELQQIGPPEVLYSQPKNTFVAQFIGSPGMNIIRATVVKEGGDGFAVHLGGQTIPLPVAEPQTGHTLSAHVGQSLFAGIRPEAFTARQITNSVSIKLRIASVEFLGHESLVYFHLAGADEQGSDDILVARIAGQCHYVRNTETVFYIEATSVYLFDASGDIIHGVYK